MLVLMNTGGVAATNCFLIADETSRQAVLFDAPAHTTEPLLAAVSKRGWALAGLWLPHGHLDHFADHQVVRDRFPQLKVLLHELDAPKTRTPDVQTRMFGLPFSIPPLKPDAFVADNQQLRLGSIEVVGLHTPGHSPGHVVYHFHKEKVLVGGDLIIGGSVGRTDLPDSCHEDLEASVRRVMNLPGDTRLLGGHGPAPTLAQERQTNSVMQESLQRPP